MADYETNGSSALAPKDPYGGMDRPNIRPNLHVVRGKNQDAGLPRGGVVSARNSLNDSEKAASASPISTIGGGTDQAKSAEQDQPFSNKVQGVDNNDGKKKKGFMGGKGPILTIMALLLGGGGLAVTSNALAPFGLVNNALDQFNSMRVSNNRRSTYFMRFGLDASRNKPITKMTIFNGEQFKISGSLQKKLAKQNIQYVEETGSDNKPVRYLVYTDPDGAKTPIVANDADLTRIKGASLDAIGNRTTVKLDDMLSTNKNYFKSQDVGTRTVRGHIAGWFSTLSDSFHKRIAATRNRFKNTTGDSDDAEVQKAAKTGGLAEESVKSDSDVEKESTTYEDGEEVKKTEFDSDANSADDSLKKGMDSGQIKASIEAKVKKATAGANLACMVLKAIGSINLVIAAINTAQVINYVTGFLEAVQKTQAGDGGSELSYYMNGLMTSGTAEDVDGNKVEGSSMSSPAINSLFDGDPVSPEDPMAKKYNTEYLSSAASIATLNNNDEDPETKEAHSQYMNSLEDVLGSVVGGVGSLMNGVAAFQACNTIRAISSTVGLASDLILMFSTAGIGNAIKALFKGIAEVALKAAATAVVMTVVSSVIVPFVGQMLSTDFITNMVGQDAGYVISSGLNMYMGKNHQSSGGTPGHMQSVIAHYRENQVILAEDAAYDRATKSPFDVTSKNTFLGSIVNKLTPLATSVNSVTSATSVLGGIGGLVSSSLSSLSPTAQAAAEVKFVSSLNEDCAYLSSMNIVGDAYCNPYYITDLDTIATDPSDIIEIVDGRGGLQTEDGELKTTENGNVIIEQSSDLSKYIIACTLRESQYGIVDTSIQSFVNAPTENGSVNTIITTGVGIIPIGGDLVEFAQLATEQANLKWNSGEACVNGGQYWGENRYYQRFIEDQNLMEVSGMVEESAVTAFVNDYYESNPLDNSYEGIIARYSGLSKDDVIATLDLMDYASFIAEYDPTYLSPVPAEIVEVSLSDQVPDVIIADHSDSPTQHHVVYIDTRYRSYAV